MSDFVAWLTAFFLLFIALVLSTSLRRYRIKREETLSQETSRGRQIIAELPIGQGLVLFTEDSTHFYYGEQRINKLSIQVVRILINGSPIASYAVQGVSLPTNDQSPLFKDQPEGIARDRWDVLIKTSGETVLVECGAIRERISQELGRKIFDAIKEALKTSGREMKGDT